MGAALCWGAAAREAPLLCSIAAQHAATPVPVARNRAPQMGFCSIRQQYSPELVREKAIGSLPALLALVGRGTQIGWEVRALAAGSTCRHAARRRWRRIKMLQ